MEAPMFFQFSRSELKLVLKEVMEEIISEDKMGRGNDSTLINIQEAAALLNLAVTTLYEKTSGKSIPHYKHGKKIMFKKSELLAWVESRKVKTIHEIREEAKNLIRLKEKK